VGTERGTRDGFEAKKVTSSLIESHPQNPTEGGVDGQINALLTRVVNHSVEHESFTTCNNIILMLCNPNFTTFSINYPLIILLLNN